MKQILILLFLVIAFCNSGISQNKSTSPGDVILGKWITEEDKSVVEVYKKGDLYYGKIISLKTPNDEQGKPKTDIHNEDPKLQPRLVIGIEILQELEYDEDNVWDGADIYDPESGNTYSCKVTMVDNNTLDIRGYIGFSLIGRTTQWRRTK
jgi:uncharacterized protein (DUF2147 family)